MIPMLISMGFGVVLLSMIFLVVVFYRAWRDPAKHLGPRYRVVAASLMVVAVGVGIWSVNPLLQAMGGPALHPYVMFVASALILAAAASLIGSTAIGGDPETLRWFLLLSSLWVIGCAVVGYVL